MKHILNDLSEQEKNAIREQHTGGMNVVTENFHKLLGSKLGDSKPLVNEQTALGAVGNSLEIQGQLGNFLLQTLPITQIYNMVKSASSGDAKTFNQVLDQEKTRLGQNYQTLKNAVTQGDISKTLGNVATGLSDLLGPYVNQMKSGFGNKQQPVSTGGGGRLPKTGMNEQAVTTAGVAAAVAGLGGLAMSIVNGSGTSDQKVKQFCDLCRKSKVQITQMSNQQADDIRDSVQGMGTDEDKIYQVIGGLKTFDEFCALVKSYQQSYSVELYNDLDDDIDNENEWVQIFRPIRNLLLRQQQQPTTGAKPTNPTFGAKTNPTFGAKPTNPTFGAKTNPTFGAKPTNPTFGAKPTAVPTKQPKFTSK